MPHSSLSCSEVGLNLGADTCTQSVFLAGGDTCPYEEDGMFPGGVCVSYLDLRTSSAFLIPLLMNVEDLKDIVEMAFRWPFLA